MRVVRHDGPRRFLDRAAAWLEEAEAERALILGLSVDLIVAVREGAAARLLTVESDGAVVTAALRTPPYNLVVSRAPERALALIAADLHERGGSLPGVEGPSDEAATFARLWTSRTGVAARDGMSQRIYECREAIDARGVSGGIRSARDADRAVLAGWTRGFHRDTGIARDAGDDPERMVADLIQRGRLFVWDDGEPTSMASWTGPTVHGVRISYVYTPPELRGRGYAASTVAALTARILSSGRRFCCLYTDVANPTSNRLYQRIGYRRVCEWGQHVFG